MICHERTIFIFNPDIISFENKNKSLELYENNLRDNFLTSVEKAIDVLSKENKGYMEKALRFNVARDIDFEIVQAKTILHSFIQNTGYDPIAFYDYFLHCKFNALNKDYWFMQPSLWATYNVYKYLNSIELFDEMNLVDIPFFLKIDPFNSYHRIAKDSITMTLSGLKNNKKKFKHEVDRENATLFYEKLEEASVKNKLIVLKSIN